MIAWIVRRLFQASFVVLAMTIIVFLGVHVIGNPVDILISPEADQAERARIIANLGLDQPLWRQYAYFLNGALHGDLGNSFVFNEPALRLIAQRMPATLELAVTAVLFSMIFGIPLGLYSGLNPDSFTGRAIMAGSILGFSLPTFWVGLMLIMVFAVELGWLPSTGRGQTAELFGIPWSFLTWDGLRHMFMPALNLSLFNISLVLRLTRAGVRETLPMDFVKFARAKGLSRTRVILVHVLKNIMIPVVTVLGLELGSTIAFAVVTESVFAWPGMGKLIIDSINVLDRPVIVAYLMMIVLLFITINLLVDILYMILDPRGTVGDEIMSGAREETPFHRFASEFAASRLALFGLVVFVCIALLAIFASLIAPQNPYDLAQLDIMDGRLPPGSKSIVGYTYLLGTDDQGRDMFSGMLYGLRISLAVGVGSALFAALAGTSLGLLAASLGSRADAAIMRLVDLQLSFPSILVALMILAALGKGVMNVVLALVIVEWAYYARTVRATAMVERNREYIEAAECLALPRWRIMFRHLLPNCLPPLIVIATQQVARAIALEATLSFLGLGVPITEPSLGLLIANGYQYMLSGKYWISFYPGIALLVTIVSINLVGDQLRDVLNPPVEAMNATIEVRNLRTHFFTRAGLVKAVDDVSFSVNRGQVLGLVGESGSGKSVTGFSIIGLVDPPGRIAGGSILYQGQDLAKLSEREMRALRGDRIAMIFQDPMMTLNPVLRIDTQMIETVQAHTKVPREEARRRARDALGMVGIPSPEERLNAYPHQFSGGMRQRVAIAIALLHNPDLLIADEPTTALDVTIQAQILAKVQELAGEHGTALIWITHDLSVIAGLADQIAVMYAGRIVESGDAAQVLDRPGHPYTNGLIGSVPSRNKRGERLRQIPGMTPSLLSLPAGCAFRERCTRADAACATEPPEMHGLRCFHPIEHAA